MHSDFLKKHGDTHSCSYGLFRNVIAQMNISFAKLGHTEFEKCTKNKMHDAEHMKSPDECCLECQECKITTLGTKKRDIFFKWQKKKKTMKTSKEVKL